jgi:hypothetical protein
MPGPSYRAKRKRPKRATKGIRMDRQFRQEVARRPSKSKAIQNLAKRLVK